MCSGSRIEVLNVLLLIQGKRERLSSLCGGQYMERVLSNRTKHYVYQSDRALVNNIVLGYTSELSHLEYIGSNFLIDRDMRDEQIYDILLREWRIKE